MIVCPSCGQENPEGARFCNACAVSLEPRAPERRKLATLLFCDVSGSTALGEALDAESVRDLMFRYFHEMRSAIERHGGTVEKFAGDEVMAAFGVPQAHEDDALRAVRAAAEMRERLDELNPELEHRYGARLALHMGVNTGEVVAGDASGREAFVTGDAVNVAARLYQAAGPGEILLGELTYRLARESFSAEAMEPIRAKGKREPVPAYRLLSVAPAGPGRRSWETPLIGRDAELARLVQLLEEAVSQSRCRLATVIGEPGVGKSRLADELSSRVASDARVLAGRCLAYGEGITYWPLAEIVRSAAGIRDEDAPEDARTKVAALCERSVAKRIASLAGLSTDPVAPGEAAWAVRRLLQALALERPLLLIVEDLHWAEAGLFDLLAELEKGTEEAVLVLLTARPDLLEERPQWPVALRLDPLVEDEARRLLAGISLAAEREEAVVRAAGGNPLFLEELATFLREEPEQGEIPPTLSALLSARLDRLPENQRQTAERGSVEGELFHRGAVSHLAGRDVRHELQALEARELIHAAEAELAGEAGYRFKHVLVRDAAYNGTTKRLRAELHERFADWLERRLGERVGEAEEILGYHLEQAYRYRVELGPVDEQARELAGRAGRHLGRAGLRAFGRSDISATVGLLRRACALLPPGEPDRLRLLPELGSALGEAGRFDEAQSVLDDAAGEARRAGDRAAEGRARIEHLFVQSAIESAEWTDGAEAAVRELLPVFEALQDEQGLARIWRLSGMAGLMRSCFADLAAAMERALEHARRAGDEKEVGLALFWIPQAVVWGPTPAEEGIRRCETLRAQAAGSASAEAGVVNGLAMLYAMVGRAEEARAALRESCGMYRELGLEVLLGAASMHEGPVELYLGDAVAAERGLRRAMEVLERLGERGYRSTAAAWLAQALNDQARYAEAEEATRLSEELASADDTPSQVGWRLERARAIAHRGELAEAEQLAREAAALSEPTDTLDDKGKCALALAEVLRLAGRTEEAREQASKSLQAWQRKGIAGYIERARALLTELGTAA
ncbi:MAG: AAA family ATPase [Actinobacteria bacterium]|nr:AAA family ATPase [Actinomycetota bacterium]